MSQSVLSVKINNMEEYPISCETCGAQIDDQEEDWNGMCEECYNTPPKRA
jgi:NMD protein affecting ribosome stability and mRNA decay